MLKRLFERFRAQHPPEPARIVTPPMRGAPQARIVNPDVPSYPPIDQGVSAVSIADIMATQSDILTRLRLASGLPENEFQHLYLRPMQNYAAYVHLLPVTRREHYRGAGGLIRYGFEAAISAYQTADGRLFSAEEGIERRRLTEPRWRYATFLAALCSELSRPLSDLIVVNGNGDEWPAYMYSLSEWLDQTGSRSYHIRWLVDGKARRGNPSYILPKIIPADCLQYIQEGHARITSSMLAVINGTLAPGEEFTLNSVVRQVKDRLIARDREKNPDLYGELTVGMHLEPHMLDAIRRMIKSGKWEVNTVKPRLWFAQDGLFLIWGRAACDEVLSAMGDIKGVPTDEVTLLETLIAADIVEKSMGDSPYWKIHVPPNSPKSKEVVAIKFTKPGLVLPDEPPVALEFMLTKVNQGASVVVAPPAQESSVEKQSSLVQQVQAAQELGRSDSIQPPESETQEEPDPLESAELSALFEKIDATAASFIRAMISDMASGVDLNVEVLNDGRMAIPPSVVEEFGISSIDFGTSLSRANWLELDPNKPERLALPIEVKGIPSRAFVLRKAIVKKLNLRKGSA